MHADALGVVAMPTTTLRRTRDIYGLTQNWWATAVQFLPAFQPDPKTIPMVSGVRESED